MENSKVDQTITRNEIETIAHFVAQKYISLEYGSPRVITQKYRRLFRSETSYRRS